MSVKRSSILTRSSSKMFHFCPLGFCFGPLQRSRLVSMLLLSLLSVKINVDLERFV